VARLAKEASKAADHVLRICVRALDYVPPVDLRFGEFLRAMITADADLIPDDRLRYRIAIAEAFRRRGIFPQGITSMAPDSLMWEAPEHADPELAVCKFLPRPELDVSVQFERLTLWRQARANQAILHRWLVDPSAEDEKWERILGVKLTSAAPATIARSRDGRPKVEVHSVRIARRAGPDGQDLRQLVIEVNQKRRAFFDPEDQAAADRGDPRIPAEAMDFEFRGGATVLVDLRDWTVRYSVRKRIDDDRRLQAQRDYLSGAAEADLKAVYFAGLGGRTPPAEPFALLHRG